MDWNRPITPAHAVGFVALCVASGFVAGLGLAVLVTSTVARRLVNALAP